MAAFAVGGDSDSSVADLAAPDAASPVVLDLVEIQGNVLAGFSKPQMALILVDFGSADAGRAWLRSLASEIVDSREVSDFKRRQSAATRDGLARPTSTWANVAVSHAGLLALGRPSRELAAFPEEFREGMRRRADIVGDRGSSDPANWPEPYRRNIHGVLVMAADDAATLDQAVVAQTNLVESSGCMVVHIERGHDFAEMPGSEHFGFRDGISQPAIRGITHRRRFDNEEEAAPGQDLIWPGEFVLGYPGQAGVGGGEAAGPVVMSGPEWARNGSYLVFRRLRQDVVGFRDFLASTAAAQGISEDLAGAKLVGRYKSGAPLARTGPAASDPGLDDPTLLDIDHVHDFDFEDDRDGLVVPLAAHIRKTYPRHHPTDDGGEEDTHLHRILRRGLPFGDVLADNIDAADPLADPPFPDDRGLLFLCYQSSISRQFEFIQRRWVNDTDFPEVGAGQDPVMAQRGDTGSFTLPGGRPDHVALMQRFVVTTGGEYFFQPSISALSMLATAPAESS